MASVTFDIAAGGDGTSINDGSYNASTNPNALGNGGHRYNFMRALTNIVNIGAFVVAKATEAAAYAASALNAPGTQATSTTTKNLATATGSQVFATQSGKLWSKGQTVVIASAASPGNQFIARVDDYTGTNLTVTIASATGSGSPSDWVISLTATGGVPITRTVSAGGLATGGGSLAGNITLTVTGAVAADLWLATSAAVAVTPKSLMDAEASVAVAYAATITLDLNAGKNFHFTMNGNPLIANPSNIIAGKGGRVRAAQDGTGGRAPTFGSSWKFPGGAPSMSPTAGAVDVYGYFAHDSSNIECGLLRNLSS